MKTNCSRRRNKCQYWCNGDYVTAYDIFAAIFVAGFVITLIAFALTWAVFTSLSYTTPVFTALQTQLGVSNAPEVIAVNQLNSNLQGFILFIPDLGALMIILMIIASWILSFQIKAHPLAAVGAIFLLVPFTIISYYISNTLIQIFSISMFSTIIGSAGLLLEFWINAPVILVICTIIDIAICLTASRIS